MPNNKKILIVEDNELNLKLFQDLLEANKFSIVATKNGLETLDLIEKHSPDLILMDIQLHGVSGFDIIKDIKSNDDYKDIPIIAVTAFAMKDDKERILESGCEVYIAKPIAIVPFLEKINELLEKRG